MPAPTPAPSPSPVRNAQLPDAIRAIVNGFSVNVPMDDYAASVKRSVDGTLDRLGGKIEGAGGEKRD